MFSAYKGSGLVLIRYSLLTLLSVVMTSAAALRLCACLAALQLCQMRPAETLVLPGPLERHAQVGPQEPTTTRPAKEKLDNLVRLKDLPRGPAVAPHKKAPQFMLDLFNSVSVLDGAPKSQKEILEGNIVRSFEDKGECIEVNSPALEPYAITNGNYARLVLTFRISTYQELALLFF